MNRKKAQNGLAARNVSRRLASVTPLAGHTGGAGR